MDNSQHEPSESNSNGGGGEGKPEPRDQHARQTDVQETEETIHNFTQLSLENVYAEIPVKATDETRLLKLMPGSFEDPICCKLFPVNLEKAPPYEPISYCWGNPELTKEISCNGSSLKITANLFEALRHFRLEDEERLLWADGICIDQRSSDDRAHQVAFMHKVYEYGTCTLVWLGESPEDLNIERAFDLMKEIYQHLQSEVDKVDRLAIPTFAYRIAAIAPIPLNHPLLCDDTGWNGIREIFENPYFRRLWVQQELGLSSKVLAFYGKNCVSMTDIGRFVAFHQLSKHTIEAKYGTNTLTVVQNSLETLWSTFRPKSSWLNDGAFLQEFKEFAATQRSTIPHIFHASRNYRATLQLDHIYGLLGHPLARKRDSAAPLIDVDYGRSIEETCVILAEQICLNSSEHPLELLCYADHFDQPDVPSWVPMWHYRGIYRVAGSRLGIDASLWSEREAREKVAMSFSDPWRTRKLRLSCLLLGKVVACTPSLPQTESKIPEFINECLQIYKSYANLPESDEFFWHNFLATLISIYPVVSAVAPDFLEFCRINDSSLGLWERLREHPGFSQSNQNPFQGSASRFTTYLAMYCTNKKMFVTKEGLFGTSLINTAFGDSLAIVFGCQFPLLFKPTSEEGHYKLTGVAWLNTYMDGAAVKQWMAGELKAEHRTVHLI